MMHLAGRRDRDAWLSDRHLYRADEQHDSEARPTVPKPRHGIRRCFKARQEAALFVEAAVNTGRAMPVQRTDEHSTHHTLRESVKGETGTLLNRIKIFPATTKYKQCYKVL